MRRKKRKQNEIVKQRRLYNAAINRIVNSEPVIRVTDRRDDYNNKRRENGARRELEKRLQKSSFARKNAMRAMLAPGRAIRKRKIRILREVFPSVYRKVHNCKQEWRKLLSWRADQGAGRKRSPRELARNHEQFEKKDC